MADPLHIAREAARAAFGTRSPIHGGPVDLDDNPYPEGPEHDAWADEWRELRGPLPLISPGLNNTVNVENG